MDYEPQTAEVMKKIENSYFLFLRNRGELQAHNERDATVTQRESNLRWNALEDLLEDGSPEFFETLEIDGSPRIVIVIQGATHLLRAENGEITVESVGLLNGGTYTERRWVDKQDDYILEGQFSHPKLAGTLTVLARNWDELQRSKATRALLRGWASSAPMARVQTFPSK